MRTILTFLLVCYLHSARATTYYFSTSSGDDSRTSTQAKNPSTPWKTLGKLNSFFSSLHPGDVVLFKRGDTFYGSITVSKSGTAGSPIVFSAYGTGNRPVITGLTTLSKWVAVGNGVYESYNPSLRSKVNMVLFNDVQKAIGRYPNKGYLTLESHRGKTSITDHQLHSTPNWKGAELVLRTSRWTIERCKITSHSGSKISYTANEGGYNARDNYGYFIQNHIKTLNQLGEWFYNPLTKKLSMYFGSNAPSSYLVKAATVNDLIYSSGKSYIVFDDITFKGANQQGVDISGGSNITIKNCSVLFSGMDGVGASGTNFKLENSSVLHSNNNGVNVSQGTNPQIRNNIVKNTYYIAGMGKSGNGQGAGIRNGKSGIVEYNQVLNSGYVGVQLGGNYAIVRNNLIDTFCFIKDDGGGIYTGNPPNISNYGRKITGNIVLNGIGAPNGTNSTGSSAEGIYMDDNTNGVVIAENTVANCRRGLYLHNTRNISVKNNILYNNKDGQLHMRYDGLGDPLRKHTITNNIFFSKIANQMASSINTKVNDINNIGEFDDNYYARPIDDRAVISVTTYLYTSSEDRRIYDLASWKAKYNKDPSSQRSAKQIAPYRINSLIGSNKYSYGSFNSSTDVSKVWANNASLSRQSSGMLDGGYLKIAPSEKSSSIVLGVGVLSAAKKYILRYSVKGTSNMSIGAFLRSSAYKPISGVAYRTVNASRSENEIIFTPSANQASGSLVFTADAKSTYYLDNIKLYEANATVTNPDDSIRFVYNATKVSKTVSLNGNYVDVKNNKFSNSIVLQPFQSAVLIKNGGVQNTAPTVSITTPATNTSYTAPATINIVAAATDVDGTISKVEFYNGPKLLHTEYNGTYSYSWSNVPAGTYSLTAKATDNKGNVTTSAVVKVLVGNTAPSVSITTPVTNTSYTAPATINMIAVATDRDGTISKVQFYNGTKLLDIEYKEPYSYSWTNVPAGTYTITAKATNNDGATTTSAGVKVTVVSKSSRPSMNHDPSSVSKNIDTTVSPVAITDKSSLKNLDFKLFPNPAVNSIRLNFNGFVNNQKATLTIQNLSGSILKRYPVVITGKSLEADISSLNTGMFIITLSGNNFSINTKFIKTR